MKLVKSISEGLRTRRLRRVTCEAFSLIEIMVAVTLMSVIVIGLMAMFGETQRAFRMGLTQTDVMESGRAAMEMMAREVEQAEATDAQSAMNFSVRPNPYYYAPAALSPYALPQVLPGANQPRVNILQDLMFLTRKGQEWKAIGYAVVYTDFVGTLYRYELSTNAVAPGWEFVANVSYGTFFGPNPTNANPRRVMDGVVDLRVRTYDNLGRLISPNYDYVTNNPAYPPLPFLDPNRVQSFWDNRTVDDIGVMFFSNALPAYVEIELGILESKTAERARAIGESSLQAQYNFLTNKAGNVQVFRQRIPIRNVDPSVYQ